MILTNGQNLITNTTNAGVFASASYF